MERGDPARASADVVEMYCVNFVGALFCGKSNNTRSFAGSPDAACGLARDSVIACLALRDSDNMLRRRMKKVHGQKQRHGACTNNNETKQTKKKSEFDP